MARPERLVALYDEVSYMEVVDAHGVPVALRLNERDRILRFAEAVEKAERARIGLLIAAKERDIKGAADFERHREDYIQRINGLRMAAEIAREG